jgi:hypothetical protein
MTMHVMNIMDRSGHQNMQWDSSDPKAVEMARAKFAEYAGRGYQAFAVDVKTERGMTEETKGRRIDTFDPTVQKLILIPQMQGG